ncbi:aspartyl-tRNA(Asn)/glutamyl-tRNA(Gln) amidotransferase subunit A [Jannaschia faecimaris]|uniref:Aspartyl-tRNA(Asn)/glutamyl-tRNA(Gln) amidotransferase subunit A n=1 Tax=Jannaschia faecimaris TaxID=1244108 RepID=A0A1H3U9V2_9RHOB|nr:amidase [Jannaschia faecimaris]SDZ59240.1 aspartyl-tRNA(Asn)/glutamyl-tRNA(Gln) amidotransferase subunit A [Jannaschia faecimaris]
MTNVWGRIASLNDAFHFCEDFSTSGPIDRAQSAGSGALFGQTIGLKSNIRVAGQAWTAGIGNRSAVLGAEDAPLVARLRAEGATIISRLAMDEGALGAATDNPHFGRCDNPAWPGHSVGGSSGGPAAAVAAVAVDAAVGSDTMGSVRIPAAFCGVFGLKFGRDTVGMAGVVPLAPSLDALGLLAREPTTLASVLDVLAPEATPAPKITGWCAAEDAMLVGCHPKVAEFMAECHGALRAVLGPPGELPFFELAGLRGDAFLLTEVEAVDSLGREAGLSPGLARLIDYGRRVHAEKLAAANARLVAAREMLTAALGTARVILLPTVAEPAFAHDSRPPVGQANYTVLANIAGCPAIAIPKPGAVPPVSVQLLGPRGSERSLIALAETLSSQL